LKYKIYVLCIVSRIKNYIQDAQYVRKNSRVVGLSTLLGHSLY